MNRSNKVTPLSRSGPEDVSPQKPGGSSYQKHRQAESDTEPIMCSSCSTVSHWVFVSLL